MLDDTYNASAESMLAALNLLADWMATNWPVLGDMLELDSMKKQGHEMWGVRAAEVADAPDHNRNTRTPAGRLHTWQACNPGKSPN